MTNTLTLSPGVTLRYYQDTRFKHSSLSVQLVRPMRQEEAAMNALLPAVLLRGTAHHRDLRAITQRLDDLYGASLSDLVRRVGDYQTTGFYCTLTEERFAMDGDEILRPAVALLRELLLEPLLEDGVFSAAIVESEKRNRIADIEADFNDKRVYAANGLLKNMCRADSFGIPRLGDVEQVRAITPDGLYRHYRKILRESPVEIFYVGAAEQTQVASVLKTLFEGVDRAPEALPPQTPFRDEGGRKLCQETASSQSILNMGFVTPITDAHLDHAAMRVLNVLLGAGMTSKLFMNIREKMSLCYSIDSNYYGSKGILVVSAGIDAEQEATVRREILAQLDACRRGEITDQELSAAKEALLSSLRGVHDSPGAIESYYGIRALSGTELPVDAYRAAVEAVSAADAVRAANTVTEHSAFFLKGVGQ